MAILDSGADCNVISKSLVDELGLKINNAHIESEKPPHILTTGDRLPIIGMLHEINHSFQSKDNESKQVKVTDVFITNDPELESVLILSQPWFQENAMKVDFPNKTLTLLNRTSYCLVEGRIPVKALIDTSSKFNTISKSLFDKLGTDHGIRPTCGPVKNLYKDAIGEIRCLDLQFRYKETHHSLDGTDTIDFEIRKNPPFDLVLGQGWLWVHEVKIIFGFSPRTYEHHGKIVIDGMSIPLTHEDFNKASSSKNNPHKSDLSIEEITNMIKKILSDVEDNKDKHSGFNVPSF
ncbi:22584_t:CDS:2 [Racocetra persica]|uniref:22584_t:CDS:1 n=1 Tax=Racocetra persica TaxID=160502 RepID=A0ACA9KS90_9GLOM|nr:22584_t:CDS:2 [Racocetra persica]